MRKARGFFVVFILVMFLFADVAFAVPGVPSDATPGQRTVATAFTLTAVALFVAVCVLLAMRERSRLFSGEGTTWPVFLLVIVAAVAMRVIVALTIEGYNSDMQCFKAWSMTVYSQGPSAFYAPDYFADYPPGYMYILYIIGWIREVFAIDWSGQLFTLILKLPSIIAEVVTAVIVYRIGKKQIGKMFGLLAGALILFNPAMLFNSSAWGQIDAVFTLFIVLTILYLKKENYLLGALFFTIALLIKPQAIMFAPVVCLAYVYALFKKGGMKKALVGILGGAAVFAAVMALAAWPFTGSQPSFWLISKYADAVNTYPYTTLNAFNLFALLGGNFVEITPASPFVLFQIELAGKTILVTWGYLFIAAICIAVIILQWRSRERRPLFDLSAFLIISVFMLAHAMHERYILPASILLIFAYVYSRDIATLWFAAAYTMFAMVSQMVTLYAPSTKVDEGTTFVLSAIGMALYIVYAFTTGRKLASGKVLIKSPAVHN